MNPCRIMVGKLKGRRPLVRSICRLVNNIKMDHREIGCDGIIWTELIWLRIGASGGLL
jgi:hypothetical protein